MHTNTQPTRRRLLQQAGAALPLLAGWPLARAQEFPAKPVRLITAFPAGSGPDAALRLVGEGLAKAWKQPVLIDNKPGGNGFIAIDALRQAPADAQKDLEPVRALFRNYFFVAVSA